jgi:hypothetical protein
MTKKSEGRIKRDQLAANMAAQNIQSPYDDLEFQYRQQRAMFVAYYEMAKLLINPGVIPFIQDLNQVNDLARTLKAEVNDLHAKTEALYATHKDKAGKMPDPNDENEHFAIIMHVQEYQMFLGVHMQTITPIMADLDDHLNKALEAKRAAEAVAVQAEPTDKIEAVDEAVAVAEPAL